MNLELTFSGVCEYLKREAGEDHKLLEIADNLLGLAIICSPIALGPASAGVLPLLGAKNELIKLGKAAMQRLHKKKDSDYLARIERLEVAYGLLCFTAFFEALDRKLPAAARRRLELLEPERLSLSAAAASSVAHSNGPAACETSPLVAVPLPFPHPTESLEIQTRRNSALWTQMGEGFLQFIQKLAFWEELSEAEQRKLVSSISSIPDDAAKHFEAQYIELARKNGDFAIWSSFHEHKKTKALLGTLSRQVQLHAKLASDSLTSVDVGFAKLNETVLALPEQLKIGQAADLVVGLKRHYQARVSDPIIEDKEPVEEGAPRLAFPRVRDAFVPQAFRVLRQSGKPRRLEDEATWESLPRRNDLGAFLLSYLTSPYSLEAPLLVLGHPGSGKSLLTSVLSAQLMSKHFTAIRVPLREVDAETGIVAQIEEAIRRITNVGTDPWAKLSAAFKNCPPIVILDGYDELLQASGKVFAGYLKEVQNFQRSEAEQGRPVRAIVTSRVTLIDKATVPPGATVMRLLEFDNAQRDKWISIWNKANVAYFREANVKEFSLPDSSDPGAEKVLALAEQPLLLLMLALYDSEDNRLGKSKALDRTRLYDSLLRRFVTREREKEKGFGDTRSSERKKTLDAEMQRLGVAALGMYNRRKVHILSEELDEDLKFFRLERPIAVASGRALSQADLLLGSFFFVHKSKAQHGIGDAETREESFAFEFLHNTFGEFLTADFILRRTVAEVEALLALQESEVLRAQLEQRLASPDGLQNEWFASLVCTPLFTRPVVLEMMREWVGHVLSERKLSRDKFVSTLDTIILNQLRRLLAKRELPSMIRKETIQEGLRTPFGEHPLLGHVAIYSINLILLRAIVSTDEYLFDEGDVPTFEDGARPWDRLTNTWRSWFALENLNGVAAIVRAERDDTKIRIRTKERFQLPESDDRFETYLNVAVSLADNVAAGVSSLLLFDPTRNSREQLDEIAERLKAEKVDLEFHVAMKRLFEVEGRATESTAEYASAFRDVLHMALRSERIDELERIARSLERSLTQLPGHWISQRRPNRSDLLRQALEPGAAAEAAIHNPDAGYVLWRTARKAGDAEWQRRFAGELLDVSMHRRHPVELVSLAPAAAVTFFGLIRDVIGLTLDDRLRIRYDYVQRLMNPGHLVSLVESHPEATLASLQLGRELAGSHFRRSLREAFDEGVLQRIVDSASRLYDDDPAASVVWLQVALEIASRTELTRSTVGGHFADLLQRAFHPSHFVRLSERKPRVALALVQVGRRFYGADFARHVAPDFLMVLGRRVLDPHWLGRLAEVNEATAMTALQVLAEFASSDSNAAISESVLETDAARLLNPRHWLGLFEEYPELARLWAQTLSDVLERLPSGGRRRTALSKELSTRWLHGALLIEVAQRNPVAAVAWLRSALHLIEESDLGSRGHRTLAEVVATAPIRRLASTSPTAFATILRIAVGKQSQHLPQVKAYLIQILTSPGGQGLLARLPLGSVSDLLVLAADQSDPEATRLMTDWLQRHRLEAAAVN